MTDLGYPSRHSGLGPHPGPVHAVWQAAIAEGRFLVMINPARFLGSVFTQSYTEPPVVGAGFMHVISSLWSRL